VHAAKATLFPEVTFVRLMTGDTYSLLQPFTCHAKNNLLDKKRRGKSMEKD
jgi:hypothetical protein